METPTPFEATKTLTEDDTKLGMVVGTVAYMSPEQAAGRMLDLRSDIFAFGVVLYELLSGRRPFAGATDLETLQRVIHELPKPIGEDIPVSLRLIVEKALAKVPEDRYQSMREMVIDLRRLVRLTPEAPVASSRKLRRGTWAAALVVTAALAGW